MSLVKTFAPKGDESGFGYYRRLAAANALWSWREIAGLAHVPHNRSMLLARPELVAIELGLEFEWSRVASAQEQRVRSWRGLRRASTDAACPLCLTEEVYVRQHWEHAYSTACPIHRVLLVDRCHACAAPMTPSRERLEQCTCGQDYRTSEVVMANESQCWLSGLIASDGTSTAGVNPKVNHVDINAVCKLVSTLCLYIDPLAPAPPKSAGGVRTVRGAVQFLAPLQTLLANWPEGFANHVGERIAAGGSGARTLNTLLGQWYVRLRSSCHGNPLEAFLRVVIDVAARDFDGALGLDSAQHLASDASGYVRVAEAAKTLGLSGDRLIKAVQAGECQFRTRRFGTRGKVYEIPKSEVDRISHFREAWVGEARACEMAGVSAAVLVNMVASSVIGADAQWRRDLLKGGPIEAVSIDELHQRINALAAPHKHDDNSVVSWTELTSRRMGDKRGIQAVMKAAASGEIVAIRRGRQLGKVAFLRSDVSRYFGTPILEAGMSLQQLSEVTGWKWESIDHWLSLGLLVSQSIMLRGQPCRVVSPAELLRFRQNYLPLADLARAMGTKSSSLADQLIDVPIVGAKTLPNGTRRGGLLRVAALGELAVLGSRVVRDRVEMSCPQER